MTIEPEIDLKQYSEIPSKLDWKQIKKYKSIATIARLSTPLTFTTMGSTTETSQTLTGPNPSFLLRSLKDVAITKIDTPQMTDPYDVIVQIAQTGICGSDVHYWQRGRIGDFILTTPIVLGHESSGIVVEVGSKVSNLEIGDKVAIEPGVPCRHCDYCRKGSYNLCPDTVFAATPPHHGTLSKWYKTAADYCYKLPEHLSLEDGALCEPVAVAVQICKVGDVRAGQKIVVFGCGPIGLLCQAVAKAYAAKLVIGIDVSKKRMSIATEVLKCADGVFEPPRMEKMEVYDADKEMEFSVKVAEMIKEKFGLGEGPDVVIEATGAQSCIQTGINLTKKGGTYVQAGMGREVSCSAIPLTTIIPPLLHLTDHALPIECRLSDHHSLYS